MLLSIKELSQYLNIKPATLYAWASQGKIPCLKIHGVVRFRKEEIDRWLESCQKERVHPPVIAPAEKVVDIDALIDRVKREVYNSPHHNGRPDQDKAGKEGRHGAI